MLGEKLSIANKSQVDSKREKVKMLPKGSDNGFISIIHSSRGMEHYVMWWHCCILLHYQVLQSMFCIHKLGYCMKHRDTS